MCGRQVVVEFAALSGPVAAGHFTLERAEAAAVLVSIAGDVYVSAAQQLELNIQNIIYSLFA